MTSSESLGVYRPLRERSLAVDECFLCGANLTDRSRSDEHVIPLWVQREFGLANERLTLLNGTDIPYRQLTIPCCRDCNNGPLAALERSVHRAYLGGFDSFAQLDRDVLFTWLAKILYGLLVRERFLLVDRAEPDEGPIVAAESLKEFRLHHLLLQRARSLVTWSHNPASIVLVRTKVSSNPRANFDYADSPTGLCLTLRLGEVGILAILQDWGTFESRRFGAIERVRAHELAPLQFRELMAFTRYMAHKYRLNPALLIEGLASGPQTVRLVGSLTGRAYDRFDVTEYAHLLAFVWQVPIETVLIGNQWISYLTDEIGNPLDVPFEAWAADAPPGLRTLDDF